MAKVPFGHAARATRAVSSGRVPSSRGYIDIDLLLTSTLLTGLFLALYHSSMACIRQQSPVKRGWCSVEWGRLRRPININLTK
jgi:hypothetical protein